jgi:nicotinamide mononucleotide transporter
MKGAKMNFSPYRITRPKATLVWSALAVLLLGAAWRHWLPTDLVESLGFITGAACVWLVVKRNIWNWPLGIANAIFFLILFWQARLFADSLLQVFYIITGGLGWYWWLYGGQRKTELPVQRTSLKKALVLLGFGVVSTVLMHRYLVSVGDSAPFWDSLTTVGSLIAQLMLTRKWLENWFLWMAVDVIYVALYTSRYLYLTAVLYAIFFAMCVRGYVEWRAEHRKLHTAKKTKVTVLPRLEVVT